MFFSSTVAFGLAISLFSSTSVTAPVGTPVVNENAGTSEVAGGPGAPKMAGGRVDFGPGGYPRANKLSDGNILGVYTALDAGNRVIRTVLSGPDGESWAPHGEVTSAPADANDLDNPYVLQLAGSSRILCAFRNHSKDPKTGAYITFRITVAYSDDNGQTWKFLSTPASDPGPVTGSWEPFLRNAQEGLQLYYSRENSIDDQDSLLRVSSDGGKTWSNARTISGDGITARDGMLGVTALGGSNLIAVFESTSNGFFSIHSMTSSNDGQSWGNRATVYTPIKPNTSAGAPQVANAGGTLVVSFMTNENSENPEPSGSYTTNTASKLVTSSDGGSTWGNKMTVGNEQSTWPGLLELDDSNVLMMFDNGGAKAQKIRVS